MSHQLLKEYAKRHSVNYNKLINYTFAKKDFSLGLVG